jgi:hypothetical protein
MVQGGRRLSGRPQGPRPVQQVDDDVGDASWVGWPDDRHLGEVPSGGGVVSALGRRRGESRGGQRRHPPVPGPALRRGGRRSAAGGATAGHARHPDHQRGDDREERDSRGDWQRA